MKISLNLLALAVLYGAATSVALAQEQEENKGFPQPIQEFPFSEAVYLQEKHEIQSTLSAFHIDNITQINNSLSYEIEYGITDKVQVSAELVHLHNHSREHQYTTYSVQAGTMASLLNTPKQALSFAFGVEFPVKKDKLEQEGAEEAKTEYSPVLIYARQLNNLQLHLNAGAEVQAHEQAWFYNAAAVYGQGRLHPVLELNGTYEEEANWYVSPGVVLNGESGWELMGGVQRSLIHADWGVAIKVLYEFTAGKSVH